MCDKQFENLFNKISLIPILFKIIYINFKRDEKPIDIIWKDSSASNIIDDGFEGDNDDNDDYNTIRRK